MCFVSYFAFKHPLPLLGFLSPTRTRRKRSKERQSNTLKALYFLLGGKERQLFKDDPKAQSKGKKKGTPWVLRSIPLTVCTLLMLLVWFVCSWGKGLSQLYFF